MHRTPPCGVDCVAMRESVAVENYKKLEDGIMVLGMARSGTSMTSSLVQRWAQYQGNPCKSKIVDPSNPKGYFESVEVQLTLIDAISYLMQSKRASSWSPSFNDHLHGLVSGKKRFASALEQQFKKLHDVGVPWCSKVPLLSVTVALWEHFVSDPVLIIIIRNPYDTARSVLELEDQTRSKEKIALYLLAWQHYLTRILEDTEKFQRRFFIRYEDVIANPERQVSALSEFLAQQFPNYSKQDNVVKEMSAMVEAKLHRNRSEGLGFEQCDEATQTQKELYALLKKIAREQKLPTTIDYAKFHLTAEEITELEKNNLHIVQNLRKRTFFRHSWHICKYMFSKLKVTRR